MYIPFKLEMTDTLMFWFYPNNLPIILPLTPNTTNYAMDHHISLIELINQVVRLIGTVWKMETCYVIALTVFPVLESTKEVEGA